MEGKLVRNYIYNILYQLIKIAAPLIVVPVTLGKMTESVLGISDFANNIASWFVLFGILGINTYGNREIAKVRDDKDQLSLTFFEIYFTQLFNMAIALGLYVLYILFFVKENQLIFALYCISVFSASLDITWFYYGIEDFKIVSLRNIVIKLVGVGLILLMIHSPADLVKFVLINAFCDLFGHLITYSGLKGKISFKKIDFFAAYKKHIRATFVLFIPTVAINVYTLLDKTMLGYLIADKGPVALYKTAQSFVQMFLYFITSIGSIMMPRIANVYHNNKDMEEVNHYLSATFSLAVIFAVPMIAAMLTVTPYFIPWYLPKQLGLISLIRISSPIILFISISNVYGIQYLVPTDHNKEFIISVISGACINFVINLLLIPSLGGIGAAIGSLTAEFAVMLIQYLFVRKTIRISAFSTFIKSIISASLMSVVVIMIGEKMGASLVCNLIQAVCGVIVYGSLMILLKEKTIIDFLRSVIKHG